MKTIFLKRKGKDKKVGVNFKLTLKKLSYLDEIIEIAPIYCKYGDTISIEWNLEIVGKTNRKTTSRLQINFSYFANIEFSQTVSFIRLTKFGDKGIIRVYDEFPAITELKEMSCLI